MPASACAYMLKNSVWPAAAGTLPVPTCRTQTAKKRAAWPLPSSGPAAWIQIHPGRMVPRCIPRLVATDAPLLCNAGGWRAQLQTCLCVARRTEAQTAMTPVLFFFWHWLTGPRFTHVQPSQQVWKSHIPVEHFPKS